MKLKNELIANGILNESEVGVYHKIGYNHYQSLRRRNSEIRSVNDYQRCISYIVNQYIKNSGNYSVNISFYHRKRICDEFENNLQFPVFGNQRSTSALNEIEFGSDSPPKMLTILTGHSSTMNEMKSTIRSDSPLKMYPISSGSPIPSLEKNESNLIVEENEMRVDDTLRSISEMQSMDAWSAKLSNALSLRKNSSVHVIPAYARQKFNNAKQSIIGQLLLLDNAVNEIFSLLSCDSFSRFVFTPEYKNLIQ